MYRTPLFRVVVTLAGSIASLAAFAQSAGQTYPNRSVRIVVPYPAGGTADALPRIVAEKLGARWGQPVIIDNRPGANGSIGAEIVAKAQPDGYTLMSSPLGPVAVNHYLYRNLAYDPTKFTPISLLSTTISVLAVRPNLPAGSVQELIALAKGKPGTLNYASQGSGSTSHLTAAMFQKLAGIDIVHVPYKGSSAALTDLMSGQVDIFFDNISSSLAQHRSGRLKILAVASLKRSPALPNTPTIDESGLEGFSSISWNVIVGPEKLPETIARQVSQAAAEALRLPDVQKKYAELGADIVGGAPVETGRFIAEEMARWRKVIQDANITAD